MFEEEEGGIKNSRNIHRERERSKIVISFGIFRKLIE
jgi:hypothetical protein